jgi:hypothetical protein
MSEKTSEEYALELSHRVGITRLAAGNVMHILQSKAIAERVLAKMSRDLPMSEEPASVFNPEAFSSDPR